MTGNQQYANPIGASLFEALGGTLRSWTGVACFRLPWAAHLACLSLRASRPASSPRQAFGKCVSSLWQPWLPRARGSLPHPNLSKKT